MEIKTLNRQGAGEYSEKKSDFFADAFPLENEEDVGRFLVVITKKYPDARHHCYAYRLSDGKEKYCDNGEPQGTAGIPMLEILRKRGLSDALVVVTRYFGGILLGTGGLARAYSAAAKAALDDAGEAVFRPFARYEVVCDYAFHPLLMNKLPSFSCETEKTDFAENVTLSLLLPEGQKEAFERAVVDLSQGRVKPQLKATVFRKCCPIC